MAALSLPNINLAHLSFTCPLYVIQGEDDTMMGSKDILIEQLETVHTSKSVHWIPGAGPLMHLTHPDKVADAFDSIRRELPVS